MRNCAEEDPLPYRSLASGAGCRCSGELIGRYLKRKKSESCRKTRLRASVNRELGRAHPIRGSGVRQNKAAWVVRKTGVNNNLAPSGIRGLAARGGIPPPIAGAD